MVVNRGTVDTKLPESITITAKGECVAADALPPYTFRRSANRLLLRLNEARPIAAGGSRRAGWIRCGSANEVTAEF